MIKDHKKLLTLKVTNYIFYKIIVRMRNGGVWFSNSSIICYIFVAFFYCKISVSSYFSDLDTSYIHFLSVHQFSNTSSIKLYHHFKAAQKLKFTFCGLLNWNYRSVIFLLFFTVPSNTTINANNYQHRIGDKRIWGTRKDTLQENRY